MALGGKLLVTGRIGAFDDDTLAAVLESNPVDRSWKELPSLLTARYFCPVAVLGGDAVVMGGYSGSESDVVEEVERYSQQSQCWEVMASLPYQLLRSGAAALQF